MSQDPKKSLYRKVRILELARMITNEQSNINQFSENLTDTFKIFNQVLAENNSSENFQKSIEKSVLCYENRQLLAKEFKNLQLNEQDSFVIIPLFARAHLFTGVVRKLNDGEKDYFSFVLVNMGDRKKHEQFEENIFNDSGKLRGLINESFNKKMTVEDLYSFLNKNSDKVNHLNFNSMDQTIGNCFVKEIEKAIKFASVPVKQIKKSRNKFKLTMRKANSKPVKFNINGKNLDTEAVHLKFLEILKIENPALSNELEDVKKTYIFNKKLRRNLNNNEVTFDEKDLKNNIKFLSIKTLTEILGNKELKKNLENLSNKSTILETLNYCIKNKYNKIITQVKNENIFDAQEMLQTYKNNILENYPILNFQIGLELSQVLSEKAEKLVETDPLQAISLYSKAKDLNTYDYFVLRDMGELCLKNGYYTEAINVLEKANALESTNTLVKCNLSKAYNEMGKEMLEIKHFDKAIELFINAEKYAVIDEEKYQIYKNLGMTYYVNNEPVKAEKYLTLYTESVNDLVAKSILSDVRSIIEIEHDKEILKIGKLNVQELKVLANKLEVEINPDFKMLHQTYRALNRKDVENRDLYQEKLSLIEEKVGENGVELQKIEIKPDKKCILINKINKEILN